jgi:hypothetical protein
MSIHQSKPNDDSIDPEQFADRPYPDPEWTPKQQSNFETYGAETFAELETDAGRRWYKRTYRPKKRNDGMMTRDHVQLGTPEDYLDEHVDQAFNPWSSFTSLMMREISTYDVDMDALEEAIEDVIRAKLRVLADNNPQKARRLLEETNKVAQLYGAGADQ